MKTARGLALLLLLGTGGCLPDRPPAPEELALEHYADGEEYLAAGRVDEAAVEYEYAVTHRPRWKEAYVKLARCRERQGRDEESISVLERLLRVDASDEDGLRFVATLYARRGDPERALDRYRRLRALHPDDRSLDGEIARLEALRKP
jgi:tetratricopeptide (TPR) repeat protein